MATRQANVRRACSQAVADYETLRYFPALCSGASREAGEHHGEPTQPKTSSDTTLTALVQLAAYQTGTARSFAFVFSASHVHAVAEATLATAAFPGLSTACRDADDLWLCGSSFPRQAENIPSIFDHLTRVDTASCDATGTTHPLLLIQDFENDARFASSPFSKTGRQVCSYASVPIRTRRGIHIGVLCVVGPRAQMLWEASKTDALSNISRALVSYLETRRTAGGYRRHMRMNRGIDSFIEGQSSLDGWQNSENTAAFANIQNQEGQLNQSQQIFQGDERLRGPIASATTSEQQLHDKSTMEPPVCPSELTPTIPSAPKARAMVDFLGLTATDQGANPSITWNEFGSADPSKATLRQDLHGHASVFSRAANLIREATEIESCLFVDAQPRPFPTPSSHSKVTNTQQSQTLSSTTSDGGHGHGTSCSSNNMGGSGSSSCSEEANASVAFKCNILAFSMSDAASIDGNDDSAPQSRQLELHEKLLFKLLRRYPAGKIFNFDASGELYHSDSSGDDSELIVWPPVAVQPDVKSDSTKTRGSKPWARYREADSILKAFPGARSVALYLSRIKGGTDGMLHYLVIRATLGESSQMGKN